MVHVQEPTIPRWSPPPRGFLKMNWDATFNKAVRFMGIGAVLRDDKGEVVVALAQYLPQVMDPSMAEAVALWKAVGFVVRWDSHRWCLRGMLYSLQRLWVQGVLAGEISGNSLRILVLFFRISKPIKSFMLSGKQTRLPMLS
jgi:hypothetical protein